MDLQTDVHGEGRGTRKDIWLLVAACVVLYGVASWMLPLADPEESRCALTVHEMLWTGEWVVPHLRGEVYDQKPAPFFWMAAVGQLITRDVELGGRLVPGLFALGAVIGAYFVTRSLAGRKAGLLAGLVLASAGLFLFMARWYRMDMPFSASMWLALACFWMGERAGSSNKRGAWLGFPMRGSWIGFYVFCALAFVFKGPAGLVLPAGVVFWYLILSRQPKRLLEFVNIPGLILFVLIGAPWYVMMSMRTPGYAEAFFIGENFGRATSSRESHGMNPFLYIPILLAGLLPWTIYLPGACMRLVPRKVRESFENRGYLFCWLAMGIPLVFFMIASTRLANYILPCVPPLAVLIGVLMGKWVDNPERDGLLVHGARAMWGMVLVMGIAVLAGGVFFGIPIALQIIPIIVTALGLTMMTIYILGDRRFAFLGWSVAAVIGLYACATLMLGPVAYDRYLSSRAFADAIPEDSAVAFCSEDPFSIFVYAQPKEWVKLDDDHLVDREFPKLRELLWRQSSISGVYVYVSGPEEKATFDEHFPEAELILEKDGRWLMYLPGELMLSS
jgi:4-amino-4-deoxy-L-arabinose transferase-like glycosyltransferase